MADRDLGTASGSANRLWSRTVTVFAATRPGRRTPRPPAAAASARMPAWPPPIDSYGGEPTPALPSSPPGLPRLARRAAVIRNRGEHDLEGQATTAPGARRPVISQDPLSPFSRRRSASAGRAAWPRRGTARTKTESTTMDPERRLGAAAACADGVGRRAQITRFWDPGLSCDRLRLASATPLTLAVVRGRQRIELVTVTARRDPQEEPPCCDRDCRVLLVRLLSWRRRPGGVRRARTGRFG